ncbi:hypothetical protein HanXRQr2_Chr14g0623281 [Helianthus annuus]|uniref:Uncharacterized protein n=1 Tax=Helianthus annuus TaxID=4232 RepID=A0A9K3H6W0_HELAN|nr:hypothetical protein HanXRQr2_Chr14g0623281 [Helianthus annuus]KAJ0838719.1 hypothetical protein HanPSC8_Chr14g0598101 [Helianthus annuus]
MKSSGLLIFYSIIQKSYRTKRREYERLQGIHHSIFTEFIKSQFGLCLIR